MAITWDSTQTALAQEATKASIARKWRVFTKADHSLVSVCNLSLSPARTELPQLTQALLQPILLLHAAVFAGALCWGYQQQWQPQAPRALSHSPCASEQPLSPEAGAPIPALLCAAMQRCWY